MEGQLLPAERIFLHDSVLAAKPTICLEVGTWRGGGSTMQIVRALEKLGKGVLYTCEPDKLCFDIASKGWEGNQHIELFNETSEKAIENLLQVAAIPDFIFFDGPEEPEIAARDLAVLEPHLKAGAVFMMHDWDLPSKKAIRIREYMEGTEGWTLSKALTAPISVGLCKYVRTI